MRVRTLSLPHQTRRSLLSKKKRKKGSSKSAKRTSHLRFWEKNRPTREGCLRKICETDIEPSALAINPKIQSKINVGEAAGFTIPIERPKNKENRYKLIEKKREMFWFSRCSKPNRGRFRDLRITLT
jgi:hypothetical protein